MGIQTDFTNNRLSRRLLFYIVICSLILIFFSTSLQLYFKFLHEEENIKTSLTNFENTVLPNIATSLYVFDEELVISQLNNLIRLPNIVYVEITEVHGMNDLYAGSKNASRDISKDFSIQYELSPDEIIDFGKLTIHASLVNIKRQLWKEAYTTLIISIVAISAIAICFFLIFQLTITRHLLKIVQYTKNLKYEKLEQELILHDHIRPPEKQDELEQLVNAINSMRLRLLEDINEIRKVEKSLHIANVQLEDHKAHLEEKVKNRTLQLEASSTQLSAANKELKDFAYIVSHDLKAPLRGIHQLGGWLSQDYKEKLDDQGVELIELLTGRIERMDSLIDGILQYSRIGRIEENPEIISLEDLVKDVIGYLVVPDHIKISIKDKLPEFFGDKTRVQQIFQNLLSNAIKFMDKPEGNIKITCTRNDAYWSIGVSDNGSGIDEKYHQKIFQIFQTLSSRDDRESTGIGLTVVKKIIELYGGKLSIESKPGIGSTFSFTLPLRGADDAEQKANIIG